MAGRQQQVFYFFLRSDVNGLLEDVCGDLCDTPGRLFFRPPKGSSFRSAGSRRHSFQTLLAATSQLAVRQGYGQQLERDPYRDEATTLFEKGLPGEALRFLGRAVEATAIVYAVDCLLREHGAVLGDNGISPELKRLMNIQSQHMLQEVARYMEVYKNLYVQRVERETAMVAGLVAFRRDQPDAYKVLAKNMSDTTRTAAYVPTPEEQERDLVIMRSSYQQVRLRAGLVHTRSGRKILDTNEDLPFRIIANICSA